MTDYGATVALDPGSATGLNWWSIDGVNQANQNTLFYRVDGGAVDNPLSSIGPVTVSQLLPGFRQLTATYSSASGAPFTVAVTYMLSGTTAGTGRSGLNESLRVSNLGTTTLNFHLFQYWDMMVGGAGFGGAQDVSIGLNGSQPNDQTVTGLPAGLFQTVPNPISARAEAALYNTTLSHLAAGADLNNNLAAGPGHLGWALQWDLSIAPGTSAQVGTVNTLQVPEPAAFALIGLALAGWTIRRRLSA